MTLWETFRLLALYEEINEQTHSRHAHSYGRQYASVTWPNRGLGTGCVCSPPLPCWKINAVEQCSSVLNNVWAGFSRRIIDRGGEKRSLLFLSITSSIHYSGREVNGGTHGPVPKHTHTGVVNEVFTKLSDGLHNCLCACATVYRANFRVHRENELRESVTYVSATK